MNIVRTVKSAILQREKYENEAEDHLSNQIINHKLQEKDDALVTLSDQVMKLMEEVQELKKQRHQ
jgi:hypothetical protein